MISAVNGPAEIRAAVLAMKTYDRDVRKEVNRTQREVIGPVWKAAVDKRAPAGIGGRVLTAGLRVAAGNPPQLVAAASKRKIGRGIIPAEHWAGYEYGAARSAFSRYQRTSPRGTSHAVERRTMRHLRGRNTSGYVLGPAVAEVGPRAAALFAQVAIRPYMEALNP